jgi:hypothetical protein
MNGIEPVLDKPSDDGGFADSCISDEYELEAVVEA